MTTGRTALYSLLFALLLPSLAADALAVSNRINGVRVSSQEGNTVVEIAGERAPNFTTFKQDQPRRVIVDVAECLLGSVPPRIQGDGQLVAGVTTAQYGSSPHGVSRVIIGLAREAEYRVTTRGGSLFVHLSPGTGGLLVSAGVPVAPERKKSASASKANYQVAAADDKAAAQDLDLPQEVTPPPEADDEHAAPSLVEPVAEPAAEPVAQPVRVAMATPKAKSEPSPAPPPPAAEEPEPTLVAQDEGEEAEEVEEVEEGDEVPVAEGVDGSGAEDDIPPPPEDVEDDVPPPADDMDDTGESDPADDIPPPPEDDGAVDVPEPPADDSMDEVPEPAEDIAPPPPPPEDDMSAEDDGGDVIEDVPAAPEYSEVEDRVEVSGALKDMTWVGFQQTMEASRVFIKTNAPVRFHVTEEGDNLVVLELENTRIPVRNNTRFLDTHFFDTAVTMITPREIEGVSRNVRIEIQLKDRVPYRAGQDENMVFINFQRP